MIALKYYGGSSWSQCCGPTFGVNTNLCKPNTIYPTVDRSANRSRSWGKFKVYDKSVMRDRRNYRKKDSISKFTYTERLKWQKNQDL